MISNGTLIRACVILFGIAFWLKVMAGNNEGLSNFWAGVGGLALWFLIIFALTGGRVKLPKKRKSVYKAPRRTKAPKTINITIPPPNRPVAALRAGYKPANVSPRAPEVVEGKYKVLPPGD